MERGNNVVGNLCKFSMLLASAGRSLVSPFIVLVDHCPDEGLLSTSSWKLGRRRQRGSPCTRWQMVYFRRVEALLGTVFMLCLRLTSQRSASFLREAWQLAARSAVRHDPLSKTLEALCGSSERLSCDTALHLFSCGGKFGQTLEFNCGVVEIMILFDGVVHHFVAERVHFESRAEEVLVLLLTRSLLSGDCELALHQ